MGIISTTRRELLRFLTIGSAAAGMDLTGFGARAQARKDVLVIGIDLSDVLTYDPAQLASYTPPVILDAVYDTLVTMLPGDYVTVKPSIATSWEKAPGGNGWRLRVRQDAKFNSGNPVTVEDVKWSFDRAVNLGAQPSQYITNIDRVTIVDADHVDILLKDSAREILDILCYPAFVI